MGFTERYKVFGFECCGECSTMIPRPFGLGIFCGGRYRTCTRSGLPFRSSCLPVQQEKEQQKSSSAEAELPGLRYGVNQRLLNWGARRAAFRPYSPDLDPKSPVFMRVFGLSSLSKPIGKPTKSRNFWCSPTQPECCIHNAAQFLRFIMCPPPIYLHTQNPRTACHAKEPQSAQIIFV